MFLHGGGAANLLRFTGGDFDSETGHYCRARYYDPSTGRFLSEDPMHFHAGTNFYRYVDNNPVLLFDPMGMCPAPQKNKTNLQLCKAFFFDLFLVDAGDGWETIADPWIAAGYYGAITIHYFLELRRCNKMFGPSAN